ncbi:hypothetical protein WD019_10500 [Fictibacillus sp. Mic-4]|uniref:hypothetical protein n=1 Tax=Fictibacillus sp. Mic-4 TaxID=3132826 RepID=UPI003CF23063
MEETGFGGILSQVGGIMFNIGGILFEFGGINMNLKNVISRNSRVYVEIDRKIRRSETL